MSRPAILVDGVSKLYRIGLREARSDTLVGAILSWARTPLTNYRRLRNLTSFRDPATEPDVIWALRDISFRVEEGEILGIIGRNGAGKSTLLKVLSRITEPTSGYAEMWGRVSSLLEVGTGFHPELTGRENVYLNGTILGMTKREIDDKFDEIVDFSGVERFIDTPVKRYSSGMNVRLAFSVAAHLEPEILLVDEVLAVGDLQFQRKCLGRMDAVAKEGRTVLFVSHNLAAIERLCQRALVLNDGAIYHDGPVQEAIAAYVDLTREAYEETKDLKEVERARGLTPVISGVRLANQHGRSASMIRAGQFLRIVIDYDHPDRILNPSFAVSFLDRYDQSILLLSTTFQMDDVKSIPGAGQVVCEVESLPLAPGRYRLHVSCRSGNRQLDVLDRFTEVEVIESNFYRTGRMPDSRRTKCLAVATWEMPGIDLRSSATPVTVTPTDIETSE